MNTILAKKKNGLTLSLFEHIDQVKTVFETLNETFPDIFNEEERHLAYSAICLHDIGKSVRQWQDCIKNNKKPTFQHSVVGCSFLYHFLAEEKKNKNKDILLSAIAFHHVWYFMNNNKETTENVFAEYIDDTDYEVLLTLVNEINKRYDLKLNILKEAIDETKNLKDFKMYFECLQGIIGKKKPDTIEIIRCASLFNRVHSCLTFCDRLASELWEKGQFTKDNIRQSINQMCNLNISFDYEEIKNSLINNPNVDIARLNEQFEVAENDKQFGIVEYPCGWGKTLACLLSILKKGRKAIIVVNTRNLVDTTYDNIINSIKFINNENINKLKVVKYYKGEYQDDENEDSINSDIIIATPDAFYKEAYENNKLKDKITLFLKTVIFDECHELALQINNSVSYLFYSTLVTRSHIKNTYTLLSSATMPLLIKDENNGLINSVNVNIYGNNSIPYNSQQQVHYDLIDMGDNNDIAALIDEFTKRDSFNEGGYIISSHRVKFNQKLALAVNKLDNFKFDDNLLCVNGNCLNSVISKRKQNIVSIKNRNNKENKNSYTCIDTNYFTQAVDISTDKYSDCIVSPNRFMQSNGRINREKNNVQLPTGQYIIYTSNKIENHIRQYLLWHKDEKPNKNVNNYYYSWRSFLIENFVGKTLTMADVYHLYRKYIEENKDIIRDYENSIFNLSMNNFKNNSDLTIKKAYMDKDDDDIIMLSSTETIRGTNNSVYVYMVDNNNKFVGIKESLTIDAYKYLFDRVKGIGNILIDGVDGKARENMLRGFDMIVKEHNLESKRIKSLRRMIEKTQDPDVLLSFAKKNVCLFYVSTMIYDHNIGYHKINNF